MCELLKSYSLVPNDVSNFYFYQKTVVFIWFCTLEFYGGILKPTHKLYLWLIFN
jgi:hypothetical protein